MKIRIEIDIPNEYVDSKGDLDNEVANWILYRAEEIHNGGIDAMPEYTIVEEE